MCYSLLFGILWDLIPKFDFFKFLLFKIEINAVRKRWPLLQQSFCILPSGSQGVIIIAVLGPHLAFRVWAPGPPPWADHIQSGHERFLKAQSVAPGEQSAELVCTTDTQKYFLSQGHSNPLHTSPVCNWALLGRPNTNPRIVISQLELNSDEGNTLLEQEKVIIWLQAWSLDSDCLNPNANSAHYYLCDDG